MYFFNLITIRLAAVVIKDWKTTFFPLSVFRCKRSDYLIFLIYNYLDPQRIPQTAIWTPFRTQILISLDLLQRSMKKWKVSTICFIIYVLIMSHVCVLGWNYTLYLPERRGTICSKQARYHQHMQSRDGSNDQRF